MTRFRDHRFLLTNGIIAVAAALIAVFGVQTVFHQAAASPTGRTVTATVGTVQSSVSATGNVASAQQSSFGFQTGGTITAVDASVGQVVPAGAVLATLNPAPAQATLTMAQATLTAAEENLSVAQNGNETPPQQTQDNAVLAEDQASVANAQAAVNAAQASAVTPSGAGSLAGAENSLNQAETSLNNEELSLAAKRYVSPGTIQQDQATVNQDQLTVGQDQSAVNETTLTAPFAGTVTSVTAATGNTVTASGIASSGPSAAPSSAAATAGSSGSSGSGASASGSSSSGSAPSGSAAGGSTSGGPSSSSGPTPSPSSSGPTASSGTGSSTSLFTLTNTSNLEVVASVPEADAAKVAVHQPATVTPDALAGTTVNGTVTAISPVATVTNNVVDYDVTVGLVNPPPSLRTGMSTTVSIITQSRSGVVQLPSAAITTSGSRSSVQLLVKGKKVTRPVTLGLVGDTATQIVAGLGAGAVVAEPTVTVGSAGGSTGAAGRSLTGGSGAGGGLGGGLGAGAGNGVNGGRLVVGGG